MKIPFEKVQNNEFSFEKDELKFFGTLKRKNESLINLQAEICGNLPHYCDLCGADIVLNLQEKVDLLINKGIFKDDNHKIIDVIEIFGDDIDLDEILESEIEAYKSDYFYCDKCKSIKGE